MLGQDACPIWREALTSIPLDSIIGESYACTSTLPPLASHILRVAILQQIWCVHSRVIFSCETFFKTLNSLHVSLFAWTNTVFADMAKCNRIMSYISKCRDECFEIIAVEFGHTWCVQDVFCFRSLFSPGWKLFPSLSNLPFPPMGSLSLVILFISCYLTPWGSNRKHQCENDMLGAYTLLPTNRVHKHWCNTSNHKKLP